MSVKQFKLRLATLLHEQHHLRAWRATLGRRSLVKCFNLSQRFTFFSCHVFSVPHHAHEDKLEVKGKFTATFTINE